MKRIVIDATPLLYPAIGVARVISQLLEAIEKLQPKDEQIYLYSRSMRSARGLRAKQQSPWLHLRLPRLVEPWLKKIGGIEWLTKGDLYHAIDHYMPLKYPEKAVVTLHDIIFLKQVDHQCEAHRHLSCHVEKFAKAASAIITCSEYTKNDIVEVLQIAPEKITVIPWGVDETLFTPATDPIFLKQQLKKEYNLTQPYLLAVGCSTGRKNSLLLLEVFRRLLDQGGKTPLVMVWQPPLEIAEKYKEECANNMLFFTGRVSDAQLSLLYQGAKAMIYPSLYEGFGLPILEAMASGTPVICSNSSSMPEVGGSAVEYINPKSDESLFNALQKLEEGKLDLHKMSKEGLARAKLFNWQECAKRHLNLYCNLLKMRA